MAEVVWQIVVEETLLEGFGLCLGALLQGPLGFAGKAIVAGGYKCCGGLC